MLGIFHICHHVDRPWLNNTHMNMWKKMKSVIIIRGTRCDEYSVNICATAQCPCPFFSLVASQADRMDSPALGCPLLPGQAQALYWLSAVVLICGASLLTLSKAT